MMYPYMTLADETESVHSQVIEKDGRQIIVVNFERPTQEGFDSARLHFQNISGWKSEDILIRKQTHLNNYCMIMSSQFFRKLKRYKSGLSPMACHEWLS